jgi:hypothetical protein
MKRSRRVWSSKFRTISIAGAFGDPTRVRERARENDFLELRGATQVFSGVLAFRKALLGCHVGG